MEVVVIGGVAAGMSAASKLKREVRDAHITVFERGTDVSYGACGLPYFVSGENQDPNLMRIRTAEQFCRQGIDVRLRHDVVAVDPADRTVGVRNLTTGEQFTVGYDRLVIATGASPIVPGVPGTDLNNVFTLKTIPDGEAIQQALSDPRIQDVVIVGSGFIGLEMAEACVRLGKQVRIVEMAGRVLPVYEPEIAALMAEELVRHGASVHTGERLTAMKGDGKVEAVVTDKAEYKADLVLLSVGVAPNTAFLREVPGLQFLRNGALIVNRRMETGVEGIFAGGDCATVEHRILQKPVYIPLGTNANKQGRIIGENLAGAAREFDGALGTSVLRVLDVEAGKTGLSEQEAGQAGIPVRTAVVDVNDHAPYYPDPTPIRIKVVTHAESGRVLGACLAGRRGAALRTDVFAVIISAGMTAEEAGQLDLGYAPPFAQVWDAVHVAVNAVAR